MSRTRWSAGDVAVLLLFVTLFVLFLSGVGALSREVEADRTRIAAKRAAECRRFFRYAPTKSDTLRVLTTYRHCGAVLED